MSARHNLTVERLRAVLDYCQETGHFTHKRRPENNAKDRTWNTRYAGKRAGYLHKPSGYWIICIDDVKFKAHVLAHLWMTGEWPEQSIDHRWGQRDDNRWHALRQASTGQQNCNLGIRCDNSSGVKGVSRDRQSGRWRAYINADGKRHELGLFADKALALAARRRAETRLHGEFVRRAPELRAAA